MNFTDWHLEERDLEFEKRKACLFRIWIGVPIVVRYLLVLSESLPYRSESLSEVWHTSPYLSILVLLIAGVCYTLGFFTWVSNLLLLILCINVDREFQVASLGTCAVFFALGLTLTTNSHSHFSVDSALAKRFKVYRRLLVEFRTSVSRLRTIYWIAFLQIASLHLLAFTHHVQDLYWLRGLTFGVLSTSSYLSYYYEFFRWLESSMGQWYFILFSYPVAVLQSIWQAGMIPLINTKSGYIFTAFWGWGFALGSLFLLQLSYLPFFEVAIWGIIFIRRRHLFFLKKSWHPKLEKWFPASDPQSQQNPKEGILSKFVFRPYAYFMFAVIALHGAVYLKNSYLTPISETGSLWYSTEIDRKLLTFAYYLGLWTPDVFNATDLQMSNQWAVIYRIRTAPDGSEELERVPYQDENGERLGMHRSDRFYFGNSVIWRRYMIQKDMATEHQPGRPALTLLAQVVAYDYRKNDFEGAMRYRIKFFQNESTNYKTTDPSKYEPRQVYTLNLNYSP